MNLSYRYKNSRWRICEVRIFKDKGLNYNDDDDDNNNNNNTIISSHHIYFYYKSSLCLYEMLKTRIKFFSRKI